MTKSPVPGVWFGAVPSRYRCNPLGFAHTITPPRRDSIATVNRMESFQRWFTYRPQRIRLRSSPAVASSAEPSPLGPFPQCIPGSWERPQRLFLGSSQAQGWLVSKSRSLTPHHPLGTSRSLRLIPFACRGRADMRKRAGGRLRESDIGAPGNSPQLRGRHDSAR